MKLRDLCLNLESNCPCCFPMEWYVQDWILNFTSTCYSIYTSLQTWRLFTKNLLRQVLNIAQCWVNEQWLWFVVRFFVNRTLYITINTHNNSGTPLVRPSLLHQKSGLSRGVASQKGKKSIDLCLDLHCQMAFPEGLASRQGGLSKGDHCIWWSFYLI